MKKKTAKATAKTKPKVKVQDLKPKKDAKAGGDYTPWRQNFGRTS